MATNLEGLDKTGLEHLPPHMKAVGEFLLETAFVLGWGDLSKDCVMDVGCGVDSLKLFKNLFPRFRRVIAMDIAAKYINYLKFHEAYIGMEYHIADITNRSTLAEWKGQITKMISFFCFNVLKNQRAGFENVKYLLKPGGEAIIITAINNPHYKCAKYMFAKDKWRMYKHLLSEFPDYQAHGDEGLLYYERLLKEVGLEIIGMEEEGRHFRILSADKFKESEFTKDKVIAQHLPQDLQDEFKREYLETLMTLNGRLSEGDFCLKTSCAKIVIKKKDD